MEAQPRPTHEVFFVACTTFNDLQTWLAADAQNTSSHAAIEQYVLVKTREIGRQLVQAHMDLRTEREKALPPPVNAPDGARPKIRGRNLDTVLGTVRVHRVAWLAKGQTTRIPLDRALDLPTELYSYGVQRFVAEYADTMSFDHTGGALHALGFEVPKRQREQIVVRMARDFEAFYAERPRPANDTVGLKTLLLLSVDSVGVSVVPSSLREATREAAVQDLAQFVAGGSVRGDPMAARAGHTHDHRMAVVMLVWDQEPKPRAAEDILEQFKPKGERTREEIKLPRPRNRRVSGTLEHSQAEAIKKMFDEGERRDPRHERRWVVLLDGSASQREQVLSEARARGVQVELVLDLIHVLHYLWDAGKALHGGTNQVADAWVTGYVKRLLTRPVAFVVSGLRQVASHAGTSVRSRAALRKCATYLENNSLGANYAHALAEGFPIASGNVEGACRHLIRDRMDLTGARWTVTTAEAVIKIRALQKSGDWDEYCRFHFHKEHQRTYAEVKKAA